MAPRFLALGVAALLLAGAGVTTAIVRDSDGREVAGAPGPPAEPVTSTTLTTLPPTTTAAPPTTTATATTLRPSTTTTRRPTTTTAKPSSTTTTTAPDMGCGPAQLQVKVTTDKASYGPAEPVRVTSTLGNGSAAPCTYNGYTVRTSFTDDAGHTFPGVSVVADSFRVVALQPGQVLSYSGTWDHRACAPSGCAALPPGPYYATVTWDVAGVTAAALTSLILT